MRLLLATTLFSLFYNVFAAATASRTSPPSGAFVVNASGKSGKYKTISSAIADLPKDTSHQYVFIYPGTYDEQVSISRKGPTTIYGYTPDTSSYEKNTVTITHDLSAASAGSDHNSATVQNRNPYLSLYNLNIANTFGISSKGCISPAIAYSSQANFSAAYGVGFYGCQDTLYANEGQQVYLKSYIEGAVDFIFGQRALAFFESNVIAIKGPGYITASGRSSNNNGTFVFNRNKIIEANNITSSPNGKYYFGRPWRNYARVVFKNTNVIPPVNRALWSQWGPSTPQTDHVFFGDYNTHGPGAANLTRASFATQMTKAEAKKFNIRSTVGRDYKSWVDMSYLVST